MVEYGGKEFNDPIVRCVQCNKIVHRAFLKKHGGCSHCGNKRVKNLQGMEPMEYQELKEGVLDIGIKIPYTIDPEFMALYEATEEVPGE